MHKRILAICLVTMFLAMAVIPTGFAANTDQVVITYGETAYMNPQYKSVVDNYFAEKANVDLNNVNSKVITAGDVNKISSGFSGKYYNSNQIFSSALLDLNQNGEITVEVDDSITTITPEMYMSALKSAGIQGGHVYVTSPVSATGESALAGIMDCYEEATDVEIPENVKEAANQEIATQAEIINNSNVSADDLNKLVEDVKEKVSEENITDHATIVNIINDYSTTYNINISDNDIENLAETIEQVQSVQDDANAYKEQISDIVDSSSSDGGFSLDGIFNSILSVFNINL
ncbi:DUF1002 domain-containing protein [Methanobrevibacter sp.]|uniref:DUF1002 domain-containing protein n=1 Tax=Methanobrevibacter sp. TaxID=66852 RepID=UPI0025FC6E3D|nr:DUF1002 domain-containing protein [Methanobrevibacter sp.]MBQ2961550.1 DUF1002 domain-containing protein [Methanobrevibacter sp.]